MNERAVMRGDERAGQVSRWSLLGAAFYASYVSLMRKQDTSAYKQFYNFGRNE